MKAGYKTSEFALTCVSALVIAATALFDSNLFVNYPQVMKFLAISLTTLSSIYTLGRSIVKSGVVDNKPVPPAAG